MTSTWPLPRRGGRRYSSPPPAFSNNGRHWSLCWLRELGTSTLTVLEDIYQETSLFHRVLISQLIVVVVAIELLRPNRADPLLSAVLEMIKIGLVADRISAVTLQLRRLFGSSRVLDFLLNKVPLVAGSSTELVLAILIFRNEKLSTAESFLIGSAYAKTLAMGALCLVLHGLCPGLPRVNTWTADWPIVLRLLGSSGVLVFASAPRMESRCMS